MPLVYQQDINETTRLGLWHILESEQFFNSDSQSITEIKHPQKRLQHLAGRFLLKELFPDFPVDLIRIADSRKPFLENNSFHFSISHCGNYAAALVSRSLRVGVDVEIRSAKTVKLKHKFLSAVEEEILSAPGWNTETACTVGWSIKEALFKWYASGKVDFRKNLRIVSVESENGKDYRGTAIVLKEIESHLNFNGKIMNGYCLTWVSAD